MSALPSSPDLSFDRKQAKALLRDVREGRPEAVARLAVHLPRRAPADATLADAQFTIARERGFENWPKLKTHIESAQPLSAQAERLLEAVREGKTGVVRRLLQARPALATVNIFTASAVGQAAAVAAFLEQDPSLATATHGTDAVPPLVYACGSRLHVTDAGRADGLRRVAAMLIDAGASPNSFSLFHDEENRQAPISALYYACMSDHLALVELLLRRGARTQDGESIYHAAQHNRRASLEALLAHGADLSERQEPYGNTPLYFLAGHQSDADGTAEWFKGLVWLLEHGADPNVDSTASRETPLHGVAARAGTLAAARELLAHGADPNRSRADGRTPYAIAVRRGNQAVAALLVEHGADTSVLTAAEAFLGASLASDAARAHAILAAHPGLLASMTEEDKQAVSDAVRRGSADALRLLASFGFDLAHEERDGGTPLHHAAWLGKIDLVRALLALGAPVNVRDSRFGSSPIAWAAHGSRFANGPADAYPEIVDALLDAGALREPSINTWGEPPESMSSGLVTARLRARGFVPPSPPPAQP